MIRTNTCGNKPLVGTCVQTVLTSVSDTCNRKDYDFHDHTLENLMVIHNGKHLPNIKNDNLASDPDCHA